VFLADWAWGTEALRSGLHPVALAGHSLGELAALAVAGVFSPEAGVELVVARSRMMAEASATTSGAMSAVLGLDAGTIAGVITGIEGAWVANDNAPGQIVVSGTREGVAAATELLTDAGARRVVPLQVSGPFHSPLMASAGDEFAALLQDTEFVDARLPVLSNADPRPSRDAEQLRERLARQITSPVRWTETMLELRELGADTLVECGPGGVLTGLARKVDGLRGLAVESTDLESILEEVS
jgi:[acyl-carrier-protein] S-malonyltransferase